MQIPGALNLTFFLVLGNWPLFLFTGTLIYLFIYLFIYHYYFFFLADREPGSLLRPSLSD